MQCPYCGSDKLKVLDTTDIRSGIRRRRECQECGERFTTYERSIATTPVIVKANGNREEFDREKLKRGIWNACAKRPIPAAEIDKLAMRVEAQLQQIGKAEVSSRIIGDLVIEGLKALDPIAYIRYAIVYLGLDSLTSVRSEIDKLLSEQTVQVEHPITEADSPLLPLEATPLAGANGSMARQNGSLHRRSRRVNTAHAQAVADHTIIRKLRPLDS